MWSMNTITNATPRSPSRAGRNPSRRGSVAGRAGVRGCVWMCGRARRIENGRHESSLPVERPGPRPNMRGFSSNALGKAWQPTREPLGASSRVRSPDARRDRGSRPPRSPLVHRPRPSRRAGHLRRDRFEGPGRAAGGRVRRLSPLVGRGDGRGAGRRDGRLQGTAGRRSPRGPVHLSQLGHPRRRRRVLDVPPRQARVVRARPRADRAGRSARRVVALRRQPHRRQGRPAVRGGYDRRTSRGTRNDPGRAADARRAPQDSASSGSRPCCIANRLAVTRLVAPVLV